MIYGSVCSGIEAATVAWEPLGWQPAFFSEIEAFPRAVLAHRWPGVTCHGDFTTIGAGDYGPIDLLVGGTPCQSFSVAGLRGGLADKRGNLALEYLRLADRKKPRWILWENVPGVLSSGGGRDFGSFLGGLGELGYGFAYRVLDAQYFGLAQRRKRVFVVGYLGDWRRAAAVLFEPASLRGDPAPRREARAGTPIGALGGTSPGGGWRFGADEAAAGQPIPQTATALRARDNARGVDSDCTETLLAFGGNDTRGPIDIATAVNAHGGPHGRLDFESETFIAHSLRGEGHDASEDGTGRGTPLVAVPVDLQNGRMGGAVAGTLDTTRPTRGGGQAIAISGRARGDDGRGYARPEHMGDIAGALDTVKPDRVFTPSSAVRRLTPTECERLQGFPDDYTAIPYRNGIAADGPRYKALGNSMAVPVMRWIGERIDRLELAR